jgi:putative DNA primase/helicase
MTKGKSSGLPPAVAAMMEAAERQREAFARAAIPAPPLAEDDLSRLPPEIDSDFTDGEPPAGIDDAETVDAEKLAFCATLDHSDTDNAMRLRLHFGEDLLVLAQAKSRAAAFAVWTGTHWDLDTGGPRALAIAQKLGGRIALEVTLLGMTPDEQKAVDRGKAALEIDDDQRTSVQKRHAARAQKAIDAHNKRRARRMNHAVTSKNKGRLEAMLACLAPHIMRHPDEFNADPFRVAVRGHTLVFSKRVERRVPANDDPDDSREDFEVTVAEYEASEGQRREDLITQLVPVDFDPAARCPLWEAFLAEMLPSAAVRRMVQVASGLGLLGVTVQKLFFHYGSGANGKSVYMEVMCRMLGDAAVTLPAETFIGEGGQGGKASPDLARLYGRRHLRVKELPEGEELRENLVKELTGGEEIAVRDLFQGYFDFKPIFTGHMSGNGYPRIQGTDNGIWRRMAVVHWPVTVPPERRRDFEELVSSFAPEHPGILNWLIEGVLIFLREGLVIPSEVEAATQEYRDEMDPTAEFCAACVRSKPGGSISAKDFYQSYVDFVTNAGTRAISPNRFGRIMKRKYQCDKSSIILYRDIELVGVPARSGPSDYAAHLDAPHPF